MKGIVFREFLELVEEKFGYEVVDEIIESSNLASHGAYTSVGTYPHEEMFKLAEMLSKKTNIPVQELFLLYGETLFETFIRTYKFLENKYDNTFNFLNHVHDTIHVEVLKLYPDAELPKIKVIKHSEHQMILEYTSNRKMGYFAEGLIRGCLKHFNETAVIEKEMLEVDESVVLFSITKIYG